MARTKQKMVTPASTTTIHTEDDKLSDYQVAIDSFFNITRIKKCLNQKGVNQVYQRVKEELNTLYEANDKLTRIELFKLLSQSSQDILTRGEALYNSRKETKQNNNVQSKKVFELDTKSYFLHLLSMQKNRVSQDAAVCMTIVIDQFVENMLLYAMKSIDGKTQKRVVEEVFSKSDLSDLNVLPLLSGLPSYDRFLKSADHVYEIKEGFKDHKTYVEKTIKHIRNEKLVSHNTTVETTNSEVPEKSKSARITISDSMKNLLYDCVDDIIARFASHCEHLLQWSKGKTVDSSYVTEVFKFLFTDRRVDYSSLLDNLNSRMRSFEVVDKEKKEKVKNSAAERKTNGVK